MTEITFQPEFSYEAVTMDYMSPIWYPMGDAQESEEAAQAVIDAVREGRKEADFGPVAYRIGRVVATRPEGGYQDEFLEAEFVANAQYWADRARAARAKEENEKRFEAMVARGSKVRVYKGRKVPVGTEGSVFWSGETKYGTRVGIVTDDGEKYFTAASNIEPVAQEVYS